MLCRTTRGSPHSFPRPQGPDPSLPGAGPRTETLRQGAPAPPGLPGGRAAQHFEHLESPTTATN